MRAFVFTDEALAGQAGRFVWLELDLEKAVNAPYRRKPLANTALPTFYIMDPADQSVVVKWVGSMTVHQLRRFLEDGRLAVRRRGEPRGHTPADSALARADRAYGAGDDSSAARAYGAALARAPDDWTPYPRAVEAMLYASTRMREYEACATTARDALARLGHSTSAASVSGSGLDCAVSLPEEHPRRAELIAALLPAARAWLADTTVAMSADDRSGLFIIVGGALEAVGDSLGARANTEAWSAYLDREAARATTPAERTVFDSHRLSAYLELGTPERAIPMLEASERDLPDDYNPPARLAAAYRALKRWDDGLAATERAMPKAYGPRKLNFYQLRADLLVGKGDREAARRTLEDAIAYARALPAGQRSEATLAALRKKLDAIPL